MTIIQYRNCLNGIIKILKKKYSNLSTEQSLELANQIMDIIINELNIEQS